MGRGGGCCSDPYATDLKQHGLQGPWQHRRTCTNPVMLLAFGAFCAAYIGLMGYATDKGDPWRIINGVDSFGNVCGRDNTDDVLGTFNNTNINMENFGFVYNVEPTDDSAPALCVPACPYHNSVTFTNTLSACTGCTDSSTVSPSDTCGSCAAFSTCVSGTGSGPPYQQLSTIPWVVATSNNGCPPYTYATRPLVGRCWPSEDFYVNSSVSQAAQISASYAGVANGADYTIQLYEFFYSSRYQVLYAGLFALAAVIVLLLLLRLFVKPVVWLLIISSVIVTIGATAMLWSEYRRVRTNINNKEDDGGEASDAEKNNRDFYLAASVLATIFTAILLFVVIAMRNRIRLAIAIFEEASRALADMPALFLSPFLTYAWLLGFFVMWVWVSLLIMTMKEKVYDPTTGYFTWEWGDDPDKEEYRFILAYHVFALLWITQFIIACGNFVVSGTTVSWYFTNERSKDYFANDPAADKAGNDGFFKAIKNLVRYHLGTVAFGSLIIAIVKAIRLVLEYIDHKFKDQIDKSAIAKFVMCCCKCCLWCLEKILKYINKNAYIITCLHGHPFCKAAFVAFSDLIHNAGLVFVINSIGYLMIFLCKVLISLGTALFVFMLISSGNEGQDGQDNYGSWFIIFFAAFLGWLIATAFLEVYSTIVDTIALCFMEDKKYNDGSAGKTPAAGPKLRKFMVGVCAAHPTLDASAMKNPETGATEGPLGPSHASDEQEARDNFKMHQSTRI